MAQEAAERHQERTPILAVDPGREKCGLAVIASDGRALERLIVPLSTLADALAELAGRHKPGLIVLGDRTGARQAAAILKQRLPSTRLVLVDEHHSSEDGRRLYFAENPPRGWRRLVPRGLLTPPLPYDDYVAVVLARRYVLQPAGKGGGNEP